MWKKKSESTPLSNESQALIAAAAVPHVPPCNNADLIEQWLAVQRSPRTKRAYQTDVERFLAFVQGKPLNWVVLADLLRYRDDTMQGWKPASVGRRLASIKSLLTFGCTILPAYFPWNVGAALRLHWGKDTLAQRILSEETVLDLLNQQRYQATGDRYQARNSVLLRLLYKTAIRREEVCRLSWRDVQDRGNGLGQITVYGKGDKTRTILITDTVLYRDLLALRKGASDAAPVFVSRGGGRGENPEKRLSPDQVYRIVRKAAERAGLEKEDGKGPHVSPHWLRHAHASHALDNGAPITLVRDTLGHSNLTTTSRYSHARPNASSGQYLKG